MVTVVLQNEVDGLQVKYGEEWVDVEALPDDLVINIGDILQVWEFPKHTQYFMHVFPYVYMYSRRELGFHFSFKWMNIMSEEKKD